MNRHPLASLGLLIPLATVTPALAADSASGDVSLENIEFKVADGLAFSSRGGLAISLSNLAFDKAKMREDGKVDIFDRMRHAGQAVTINLDKGEPTMCIDYAFEKGDTSTSGSVCESGVAEAVKISQLDDKRVAGSMSWNNGDDARIAVKFDLAIEPSGN